jgi:alkylation response protein AidB-like acyl-CoA dehydrogenase
MNDVFSKVKGFVESTVKDAIPVIEEKNLMPSVVLSEMASMGLFGLLIPKKYGGLEVGLAEYNKILELLGKECPSIAHITFVHTMGYDFILKHAIEKVKEEVLPDIASGKKIVALPFTEPKSGTDLASLDMKAEKEGEYYILNGVKTLATNALYAELFVVLARTGKPEEGPKGLTLFLVEKGEGVKIEGPLDLMSPKGTGIATIAFEEVKVHESNVLGVEGRGFSPAVKGLALGRIPFSSIAVGIAAGALEEAVRWALKRKAFGKPIFENQGISFQLAEIAAEIEAVRALIEKACRKVEDGEMPFLDSSSVKLLASNLAVKASRIAIQVMGGWGLLKNAKVSRLYKDAKAMEIAEGTNEVQKIIISRELERLYRT